MILATMLLLSAFSQEPIKSNPIPAVGTEKAVQAQNEFRDWLGAASKSPKSPVHLEYAVDVSLGLFDPAGDLEATFAGIMTSDVQSQSKMRHQLIGRLTVNAKNEVPAKATLVLDGESFWFALSADGLSVLPKGGFYFTGKIADLQKLYAFTLAYHQWAVEQETLHEVSPSLGLGKNFAAFFRSLPEQGVALLHPTSTLYYAMAPFTCQKLEQKPGVVQAFMALDGQPEAFLVELAAQWDDLWSGFLGNSKNEDRSSKAFQSLSEHLFFTLSFDAATALPLALNLDFHINAATLGLGTAEERMTLIADVSGKLPELRLMDASMFTAPLPDQVPTDVTGLLEMALAEMRREKADLESENDGRF